MTEDDMCPICRSSRYLNPDMVFLVNPECYHKMCTSCVDRIFSVGPAPCPYKGCGKILRKGRFKSQVFDDLKVEREVDVRHRICRIFNRREDSFNDEREYNDYLEKIESLIFDIAQGTAAEKQAAESEVEQYDRANKQEILQNALKQKQDDLHAEAVAAHSAEHQRRLRLLAIELQQHETEISQQVQQETLLALEAGGNSQQAVKRVKEKAEKQLKELRSRYEAELQKQVVAPVRKAPQNGATPRTPFTPFAGDRPPYEPFQVADHYLDPTMDRVEEPSVRAGGFTAALAQREALTLAFMSLDVDIQLEKAQAQAQAQAQAVAV